MSNISTSILSGSLELPVVNKLRGIELSTRPGTPERAQAALPVLAELEEDLDDVLNCVGVNGVLMVCRLNNPQLPSCQKLRNLHAKFKEKLRGESRFMRKVIDTLPAIASKYQSSNPFEIIGDAEFVNLLSS